MSSPKEQYLKLLDYIGHGATVTVEDIGGEPPRLASTSPYREDIRKHTFVRGADALMHILDNDIQGYEKLCIDVYIKGFMRTLSAHGLDLVSDDAPLQVSWPVGDAHAQLKGMADRGDAFAARLDREIDRSPPLALVARFGHLSELIELGETYLDSAHTPLEAGTDVKIPSNLKLPAQAAGRGRGRFKVN